MTILTDTNSPDAAESASGASSAPPRPTHSWLHTVLVEGPDPAGANGSFWETLLNWPTRLLLVLGATLIGLVWARYPLGVQVGWGLNYGLLAGISVMASLWLWVMLLNGGLALLWLVAALRKPLRVLAEAPGATDTERGWDLFDSLTWLNRQAGHTEALAVWTALAFVFFHELTWQLAAFSAVLLLAEPCLNGLARWELRRRHVHAPERAEIMIARRKWIYGATLVGFVGLSALAWRQTGTLLPLFLTVLPGMGLRLERNRRRKGQEIADPNMREVRLARAERQRRAAPVTDAVFGPGLAVVVTVLLCVGSLWEQRHLRGQTPQNPVTSPDNTCVPEPGGPVKPTLAVMLLADSQVHTLGGARFPGQLELADTVVPVALRPVELDMLSAAAVTRVAKVYRQLAKERADMHFAPPLWAHLGDFADLACADELNRALRVLGSRLGVGPRLAGFAPGNHDSNFTGNFLWSPFWDSACDPTAGSGESPGRVDKARSDRWLASFMAESAPDASADVARVSKTIDGWTLRWPFHQPALARITVTRLGVLPGAAREAAGRGVVGVFLDSSDLGEQDFGVPGEFAAFSSKQRREVLATVDALKASRGDDEPWQDPYFVLFTHHPYRAFNSSSRQNLDALVMELNQDPVRPKAEPGRASPSARVLALITAHTHTAEEFLHEIGSHRLREVVLGSVIDPPQQAAWLEIGLDTQGRAALRVSTLPTVAREGRMCSSEHAVPAGVCQRAMARLASTPECHALLTDETTELGCETLERELTLNERLNALTVTAGTTDPRAIRQEQDKRARALLECVARPSTGTCPSPTVEAEVLRNPLHEEAYAPVIEQLAADDCTNGAEPSRADEVACLAWAASAIQAHKANGMTMASAVRCAFEDPSLPAARVTVATEER